jgi:hypothetical protein
VNLYTGELGYFQFDECEGVPLTLHLEWRLVRPSIISSKLTGATN